MPNYNNEKYLIRSIESIIKQSYLNWELLIIDNNSSDNSINILEKYKDKRIKIYKTNNNGIIAKSRNIGLKNATGEWISF